jgi:hypothetical protein
VPTEQLVKTATPVVWADTTDYVDPTSGGVLARTHQIDLTSLADGAARQGAKADLGATRAKQYRVLVGIEMDVAPASGATIDFHWAASPEATAAEVNPGGTSGADAGYTGTAGDSLDDSLDQLEFIGSLRLTSDAATVVQYGEVGMLSDLQRYGMPVVDNNGGQAFEGDAVEMFVALVPIVDEGQ